MSNEVLIRNMIQQHARELIDIPWVHQGRTMYGVDCGGVIAYVLKKGGLSDFDTNNYGRRPRRNEFIKIFIGAGAIRLPLSEMQWGDVIVMRIVTFPSHCGVLTSTRENGEGRLKFVHAYTPHRKVVESPYDSFWKEKTWGVFRLPGVPGKEVIK